MKSYLFSILFTMCIVTPLYSQAVTSLKNPSYHITAKLKPYQNQYAYLAYYFADGKQYLVDSAMINNQYVVEFKGKKKIQGGVYIIILPQKKGFIDILLDQERHFSVSLDTTNIKETLQFNGSSDNTAFYRYQSLMTDLYESYEKLSQDSTKKDYIEPIIQAKVVRIEALKDSVKKAAPKRLISKLFHLFDAGTIPSWLDSASSLERYQYSKKHYWDGVSFADQRLIYTPIIDKKIDGYFDKMIVQHPDSIWTEVQHIIDQIDPKDTIPYSYYLNKVLFKYGNSDRMGFDGVYVKTFEKYLLNKKPTWIKEENYSKMQRKYFMTVGNIIGNKSQNLELLDTAKRPFYLHDIVGNYTVVCFWDPTCSHCTETIPRIDSMYQNKWKEQGIKMVGVYVDGGLGSWKKWIRTKGLSDWMHGYQSEEMINRLYENNIPSIQQAYNIVSTPSIYLLDENMKIVAKNVDHYIVDKIIDFRKNRPKKSN